MTKLSIPPNQASYTIKESTEEYKSVQLDGGASYYFRDVLGSTNIVSCTWDCNKTMYDYLWAFYRVFKNDMNPFTIDLITQDWSMRDVTAWFIPGTFRLSEQRGNLYVVVAELEVIPPVYDIEMDRQIIDMYNNFGPYWQYWEDMLQIIVNQSWPVALKAIKI